MGKENIVCGKRVIREIFKTKIDVETLYISKNLNKGNIKDILDEVNNRNIKIKYVYSNDMENMCNTKVHQGIAAKISNYKYYKFSELIEELKKEKLPILLILDGIQDPQNLGAIFRSAECMGIKNIIVPQKRSSNITDTVWKSSMGALAHLNICRTNNLVNVVKKLKDEEFKIVATTIDSSRRVYEENYKFPIAIIIGNEHEGVSDELLEYCDIKINIPMYGNITSFNVSVASGIVMYEIKKQRGE